MGRFAVAVLIALVPLGAAAQGTAAAAFNHSIIVVEGETIQAPGWSLSGGVAVSPSVTVVGHIAGAYGNLDIVDVGSLSVSADVTTHTFMGGVEFSPPTTPAFFRMLAGLEHAGAGLLGVSVSETGFAFQPGVGIDIPFGDGGGAFRVAINYRRSFHEGGGSNDIIAEAGVAFDF